MGKPFVEFALFARARTSLDVYAVGFFKSAEAALTAQKGLWKPVALASAERSLVLVPLVSKPVIFKLETSSPKLFLGFFALEGSIVTVASIVAYTVLDVVVIPAQFPHL